MTERAFIQAAIREDIGDGDHSSNSAIPASEQGKMQLIVKETGVLAGLRWAQMVFEEVDPKLKAVYLLSDGAPVNPGEIAFTVEGPVRGLLRAERLALNIMQRMSGIATYTHRLAKMIAHTNCKLLDTRKTTPNLRALEKEAVRIGGGHNHRFGLYDMIMLKDNHVDFAGGVKPAIEKAQQYLKQHGLNIPIEVETRNLDEIEAVLSCEGVLRVMFDNFTPAQTKEAVALVNGRLETESSGGINESTLVEYAETGVDFVSIGALTHSVSGLDMSLKAIKR